MENSLTKDLELNEDMYISLTECIKEKSRYESNSTFSKREIKEKIEKLEKEFKEYAEAIIYMILHLF